MSLLTKTAHVYMLCLIVPKLLLTCRKENALSVVMLWRRVTFVLLAVLAMAVAACGGAQDTQQAPSFTLTGASGEQVSLSDYVGSRPVLLYFHMAVG
ncbi:redoxin domain-containing protein [bacterium]|nr:redoxin domain-containing protein [bacterium]